MFPFIGIFLVEIFHVVSSELVSSVLHLAVSRNTPKGVNEHSAFVLVLLLLFLYECEVMSCVGVWWPILPPNSPYYMYQVPITLEKYQMTSLPPVFHIC